MKSTNSVPSVTSMDFSMSARTDIKSSSSGVYSYTGGVRGFSSTVVPIVFFFFGDWPFSSFDFSSHFLFALVQEGLLFTLGPFLVLAGVSVFFSVAAFFPVEGFLSSCFNNAFQVMPLILIVYRPGF